MSVFDPRSGISLEGENSKTREALFIGSIASTNEPAVLWIITNMDLSNDRLGYNMHPIVYQFLLRFELRYDGEPRHTLYSTHSPDPRGALMAPFLLETADADEFRGARILTRVELRRIILD